MKKLKIVMVVLVISLMLPAGFVLAYGGDGDGDGDSADAFAAADSFAGGGAVSWGGIPGYPNVRGSSVWDCNPVGPFQSGTAIQDSVQDLIDGYQDGRYTKDDVRNSLAWAEGVGISVNSTQRGKLDSLMNPPPPKKVKKVKKSEDSKVADQLEIALNIWVDYHKTKKENGGIPPSMAQIGAIVLHAKLKSLFSK